MCVTASPARNGIKKPKLESTRRAADATTAKVLLPRWKTILKYINISSSDNLQNQNVVGNVETQKDDKNDKEVVTLVMCHGIDTNKAFHAIDKVGNQKFGFDIGRWWWQRLQNVININTIYYHTTKTMGKETKPNKNCHNATHAFKYHTSKCAAFKYFSLYTLEAACGMFDMSN